MSQERLRALPSVDRLLQDERVRSLVAAYSHESVTAVVRETLADVRQALVAGHQNGAADDLPAEVERRIRLAWRGRLTPVINATGVVIHTNLGRAVLSDDAIAAVTAAASGYSDLELDLPTGERGSRHAHVEGLLTRLTGAEAALAVNNNASAVTLALAALAIGREVIVSRGQAVEIGGGFRVPDVLRQSGARLVEVGTTNRTYARDYEAALTLDTGALLRVHSSNFRVIGFTHETPLRELVELGDRHGIPVLDDLGSGALLDTSAHGLAREPMVQESVAAGASVICFSGDKLLGGPQAGIVVGRRPYVERLKRHPLARAVRLDKLTLSALQSTLLHYLREEALTKIPVWQMIGAPVDALQRRAAAWARRVRTWGVPATVVPGESTVGGGSLPGETLPTRLLSLGGADLAGLGLSPATLAERLRLGQPAVMARIDRDRLLLDPRTVLPREEAGLFAALQAALRDPRP